MPYYRNVGYSFTIMDNIKPDGGIILSSGMPSHQLERRNIDKKFPYLKYRLFDPQLYMAGLDINESPKHCIILASYPWFGITGLKEYDSSQINLKEWKAKSEEFIRLHWTRNPPNDPREIQSAIKSCIDFQLRLNCWGIILPSPLTLEYSTDYSNEINWLDESLEYTHTLGVKLPIFATIAISDSCLRYFDPSTNQLLNLILDVVSSRKVDGVYLIFEQGTERPDTRYIGNLRVLWAALHMVHILNHDCHLRVVVNFFGPFGLALEAAGAEIWASDWYKSLVRFRLADKLGAGRAFPLYWSYPAAIDIHTEKDFDALRKSGLLSRIRDQTTASDGLFQAASMNIETNRVPDWQYRMSNTSASIEHYRLSMVQSEKLHAQNTGTKRLDFVQNWLLNATKNNEKIKAVLEKDAKTRFDHVQAWAGAFREYRRDQNI